jgi:hypothetical protein
MKIQICLTLNIKIGFTHKRYKPATQKEVQSNHDDWWNSLTDEQKQKLYNDQEEAFKLTIEEMNDERE